MKGFVIRRFRKFFPPQIDYTKANACKDCYTKRENVSLAHEDCSCSVTFKLDKAFKVTLRCRKQSQVSR